MPITDIAGLAATAADAEWDRVETQSPPILPGGPALKGLRNAEAEEDAPGRRQGR